MKRYGTYLEDASKSVPRSSSYRRGMNLNESSTDDSEEIPISPLNDCSNSTSINNEGNNDGSNVELGARQRSAIEGTEDSNSLQMSLASQNETMEIQRSRDESNELASSTSQQITDERSPHHLTCNNDKAFGSNDSENESFQESWISEAQEELLGDSGGEYTSSESDESGGFVDDLPNIEEESIEEDFSFHTLIDMLQKDENNETLNAYAVVSKAEMLLAVLKLGLTYNFSQAAIADIFKMINCFFGAPILPETRYRIDQLFNSNSGIEYHAVCPNCKRYVGKFVREDKYIVCNLCHTNILLKHPTYNDYFAIINVNNEIINLLQENAAYYNSVVNRRMENVEGFQDITDGEMYKKFVSSLPLGQRMDYITTTFNSDGSPLFESSKCSVWPIQMIINELPFPIRSTKPIICGLWFGKEKPDMNIFLDPYVEKLGKLSNEGLKCKINNEERNIKVFPVCCCVDSVARAPMQGITQFNGHFGCSWCLHPGVYVRYNRGGSIKYILLNEKVQDRKENETLRHMEQTLSSPNPVYGVKKPSCLMKLPSFNLIRGFVPCSMHCISLGIAEQFAGYWVNSKNEAYSLTNDEIKNIDDILWNIKAPNQICRLTRKFKERNWWKAREWENWTLFYSIPILLCFSRLADYVNHWSLLVEAFYILLKERITRDEINYAHKLLQRFIVLTERYYGQRAMTYNVHQLQHLSQSVADWGPLWAHSGYCFESGNGRIIQQIHSAKGVVHQLCRSISMSQSELILKDHLALKDNSNIKNFVSYLEKKSAKSSFKILHARYFGRNRRTKATLIRELELSEESRTYSKIVKHRCLYTSYKNKRVRSDNSIAVTTDGLIIRIIGFILDVPTCKEITLYNVVNTENILDNESLPIKKVANISNNVNFIDTNHINKICVFVNANNAEYVCPVPNLNSY